MPDVRGDPVAGDVVLHGRRVTNESREPSAREPVPADSTAAAVPSTGGGNRKRNFPCRPESRYHDNARVYPVTARARARTHVTCTQITIARNKHTFYETASRADFSHFSRFLRRRCISTGHAGPSVPPSAGIAGRRERRDHNIAANVLHASRHKT